MGAQLLVITSALSALASPRLFSFHADRRHNTFHCALIVSLQVGALEPEAVEFPLALPRSGRALVLNNC